jgi:hypothetical protein
VVVAMTHDHGLIPVKYLGVEQGVNVTLGLPFVRTSPDHGTAFDIAGRGVADASSLVAAIARRGRWWRRAPEARGASAVAAGAQRGQLAPGARGGALEQLALSKARMRPDSHSRTSMRCVSEMVRWWRWPRVKTKKVRPG